MVAEILPAEVGEAIVNPVSLADRRRQTSQRRAMSIAEFCERYEIGRTKVYEEIKSGRLRARKVGKRTIISEDDAEAWLLNLPTIAGFQCEGSVNENMEFEHGVHALESSTKPTPASEIKSAGTITETASGSLIDTESIAATDAAKTAHQETRTVRGVGRPSHKHAWELVDDLVKGRTFIGPSACAQIVLKDLGRCYAREKTLGREFDIPTEGTIRNYLSTKAKELGITWQSKHLKRSTK